MDISVLITVFVLLSLISAAAIFRLSAIAWSIMLGIAIILVTAFDLLPVRGIIFCWLCYLAASAFANLHKERRRYITGPLLTHIKKQLPVISRTEQEAIDAGNTWWEKELFCGAPDWRALQALPTTTLTSEELAFIDQQTDQICHMLNDWQINYDDYNLPDEVWNYIKQEKFFGLIIPREYGGHGFSALAHSTIISKIATRCISAAVNIMVPNSLGPAELILRYGTEAQKKYYLPRLAVGEEIPCFALTAPHAGSDASNIPDTGIVCKEQFQGKEVVGLRLTWDKRYITLAPIATVLGLAVHAYDPDHLLGQETDIGITLCLIPTNHPGVEIGTRHLPMQMAFMNGPTRGDNVFIPLDWIIGGADKAGDGWHMLMECLSIGRSISLPALSTAGSKLTYRCTGAYARIRKQFNTSISSFEGVEESLGKIAGIAYLTESTRIMTASAIDTGINPSTASAIAKYHMTEMCRTAINSAMDIHGGHMIQAGPRNILSNLYTSIPVSITVEGANILTRNLIIFGQGAIRCHPYLLKEIALMTQPETDMPALDKLLMEHIGFFISNMLRSISYGVTGGRLIFAYSKNSTVKKYQRQLTRMSAALAFAADTCLITLGGSLKRRERISARLGDILSQLYLASAVMKHYQRADSSPEEKDYLSWSLAYCLNNIQHAFNELFQNMPIRPLGWLLKWCIFPFGQAYQPPSDQLTNKLVAQMIQPGALRDKLTQFCFISSAPDDLTYRLEKALLGVEENDVLRKKLQKGLQSETIPKYYPFIERVQAAKKAGILTDDEAERLITFEALRDEIIKVDEFTFDLEQVVA